MAAAAGRPSNRGFRPSDTARPTDEARPTDDKARPTDDEARPTDKARPTDDKARPTDDKARPTDEAQPTGRQAGAQRQGSVSSPGEKKRFPRRDRDRAMTRTMRRNGGLVTRAELVRAGFTNAEIHGFVAHGDLRRLHRRVYADGRAPLTDHALLRAPLLAFAGRDVWLSARAASMGWGLEPVSVPNLEVTVVANATPRRRAGLTIRSARSAPHPSELRTRNNLRVSSIPRMLIECSAAGAGTEQLHRLIELAVRRNLLDIPDLAATLERHSGAAGTRLVHATCQEYLPHRDRKSGLERAFDRWLARHPEIPPPQRNIRLGPWEIDCYWPDQSLVAELDGRPYHTVIEDIERDNRKNTWLQANGKRILRVTDARFKRDKAGVYRDLRVMLAVTERATSDSVPLAQSVERDVEDVLALAGSGLLDLCDATDQLDDLGEVGVRA